MQNQKIQTVNQKSVLAHIKQQHNQQIKTKLPNAKHQAKQPKQNKTIKQTARQFKHSLKPKAKKHK